MTIFLFPLGWVSTISSVIDSHENKNKKILAIGDNLNPDIRGANLLNYDSLLISNGIHRDEIKNKGIQNISKEYEVIVNYIQSDLKWWYITQILISKKYIKDQLF